LRVIAGTLGGRRIQAPKGRSTRPTSDRVRESLFNLLGALPSEAIVLDLYAGSGALGIEALSRGAVHATFVERGHAARRTLRANLEALGLSSRARVVAGDAMTSDAWARGPFDLIFADPPYDAAVQHRLVEKAASILRADGVVALEHSARGPAPEAPETLALWKSRRYGDTEVTLYRRKPEDAL
jgi:16S rRNA (guanine966-N2)-methyltransferase